jgi:hypothetical protein
MDMQSGWVVGWMVGGWVEREARKKGEYQHNLFFFLLFILHCFISFFQFQHLSLASRR